MAQDPETARLFVLVHVEGSPNPRLMVVDACTGLATDVGSPSVRVEDITFEASGVLWAATDTAEPVFLDSIFRLSTVDGSETFVSSSLSPAGGEGLAYNPIDGRLYRHSGGLGSSSRIFEAIELGTLAREEIKTTGDLFFVTRGMAHLAGDWLALTDPYEHGIWTLAMDGHAERLTTVGFPPTGIVIVEGGEPRNTTLLAVSENDVALRRIDAYGGRTLWCVPITMNGVSVTGASGIAENPVDGTLYAILNVLEASTSQLATVDGITGTATLIGDTGSRLEEITFLGGRHGSTLYGVSADDAPTSPEWLFTVNTDDATLTPVMGLGDGTDGESIAFHPLDGQIYHASGVGVPDVDRVFERVDVVAGTVTDVALSGAPYSEATAMAYLASGDLVLADSADRLYTITQSGEVTFVADLDTSLSGLVLLRKGVGENVCIATPNSTGAPAAMSAFGSDRARPGHALTLTAEPVPDQTGLFFFGPRERQIPFGHGYLCVGGGVRRVFPPVRASGHTVSVAVLGSAFSAAETTYFQYWFRDPAAGGAAFNTSDALRVRFKF